MKTKLLGVVAAIASHILLSASPGSATTYQYIGSPLSCGSACGTYLFATVQFHSETTNVSGTFSPDYAKLWVFFPQVWNPIVSPNPITLSAGVITAWGLSNFIGGPQGMSIGSSTTGDFFNSGTVGGTAPPGSWSGPMIDQYSTVPLPAALPLFATGLAALGLLGWRKKRKHVAT